MFLHTSDNWVHYWNATISCLFDGFIGITDILEKRLLFHDNKSYQIIPLIIFGIPLIALITTGVGLFEANAIQFGLDQLLEAPTPKLIAFIHWYCGLTM